MRDAESSNAERIPGKLQKSAAEFNNVFDDARSTNYRGKRIFAFLTTPLQEEETRILGCTLESAAFAREPVESIKTSESTLFLHPKKKEYFIVFDR